MTRHKHRRVLRWLIVVAYIAAVVGVASIVEGPASPSPGCPPTDDSCADVNDAGRFMDVFFWFCVWLAGILTLAVVARMAASPRDRTVRGDIS